MSSLGYIYVTEEIRDMFEKKLDKVFGKRKWHLSANEYSDIWDRGRLPIFMNIEVLGDKGVIGYAEVTNRVFVDYDGVNNERCVGVEPKKIKIRLRRK